MANSSGWYGNKKAHARAGKAGGQKTSEKYGEDFFSSIGKKGGKVSPGNFKNDPLRAKLAGSHGGRARHKVKKDIKKA